MCGRYTNTLSRGDLEEHFRTNIPSEVGTARYNVAPTEEILTLVRGDDGAARARIVRWGLLPWWSKDRKGAARMINARVETVDRKSAFRDLIAGADGRALVLADGWYEWLRAEDPRQPRRPMRFCVDGGAPFAFAGLWTSAKIDGERIETATILTCSAAGNAIAAPVHDRMPVVLADAQRAAGVAERRPRRPGRALAVRAAARRAPVRRAGQSAGQPLGPRRRGARPARQPARRVDCAAAPRQRARSPSVPVNTEAVGKTYPATVYVVGREKIREYAHAVGETNPLHLDVKAARAAGHADVVAPPMFAVVYSAPAVAPGMFDPQVGMNFAMMVHGGQQFEWGPLVVAGDEITTTASVKSITERDGMGFFVFESVSTNQAGERVARGTWTNIVRGV